MAQILAYDSDHNMNWDVVTSLGHDVTASMILEKPLILHMKTKWISPFCPAPTVSI
jgi:hypothetical protein